MPLPFEVHHEIIAIQETKLCKTNRKVNMAASHQARDTTTTKNPSRSQPCCSASETTAPEIKTTATSTTRSLQLDVHCN